MANQVMTVLEGRIPAEKWAAFQQAFESAPGTPPQMERKFLVQSSSDPEIWRAMSVWKSREQLDEYRSSVETPGGVLFFRSVGIEPTLNIYDVRGE